MQTISQAAKLLADHYGFVTLRAYLDGTQITAEIGRGVYTASVGGDELTIGNACAASMQLTVNDALPGIGGKALSITWAVDATEYPLFTGIVEDPAVRSGQTTITAYDAMYYGGADAFSPTAELLEDVGAARALTLIGTAMGVSVAQEALTLAAGVTIPGGFSGVREDISNAQAAGYVAAILGGNALIDREGNLTVRQYAAVSWETEVYSGGADAKNADYTVTGVTFRRTDTVTVINADGTTSETEQIRTYEAGDGTLAMDNPLCDQAAATRAYTALAGVSVRAGSYGYPAGIQIEPGDIITARSMDGSYAVAATSITMTLDGGVKTNLRSGGAPPSGGASGPISQALKVLQADIAHIRQLVAENADINSANIGTLQADWANIGTVIANTLWADDVTTKNLTVIDDDDNVIATFRGSAITLGEDDQSHLEMDYHSLQLIDKEGHTYFYVSDLRDADGYLETTDTFSSMWTSSSPVFTLTYPVASGTEMTVTVNGTEVTNYTLSGQTLTLSEAPPAFSTVVVEYTTDSRNAKAYTLGSRSSGNIGGRSVVEGVQCVASGYASHAEGQNATASGNHSHAEGHQTTASGYASHAEGYNCGASGNNSHAEGYSSSASGAYSHAGGLLSNASGTYSFAHGQNIYAIGANQTVIGKYNIADTTFAFIIGNGTDSNTSNALTVDWSGNVVAAGSLTINGSTNVGTELGKKVPTTRKVNNKALSADISLTASDVGAVPTTRTVNGKALSSNISLTAADVGALKLLTKTVTGTTTAAGNLNLGLAGADYGILSVKRTDANGMCTPYIYAAGAGGWYVHITNIAASPTAITNTAVTLEVDYYAK